MSVGAGTTTRRSQERSTYENDIVSHPISTEKLETVKRSGFSVQTTIKEELLLQELCKHHPYTVDHMRRVEQYSTLIGKAMGLAGHSLAIVRHAGKMHDIGKLDVPQDLLNFRDDLTEAQMDKIKRHTLSSYIRLFGLRYPKALKEVPFVASAHHEHLDGSGYNGLKGNEIPLEARIVTVDQHTRRHGQQTKLFGRNTTNRNHCSSKAIFWHFL